MLSKEEFRTKLEQTLHKRLTLDHPVLQEVIGERGQHRSPAAHPPSLVRSLPHVENDTG